MSIITISRSSCSQGKTIAEKVAEKTGYEFVFGDPVLRESNRLNIPESDLIREIRSAPSILEWIEKGKGEYVEKIGEVLLEYLLRNNVVYYGVVGQAFLQGVPHVLNIRIVADPVERAGEKMKSEGISRQEAVQLITEEDEERRRWNQELHGYDTWESKYYDLVLKTGCLTVDCIVDLIVNFVKQPCFETVPEFQERIQRLEI